MLPGTAQHRFPIVEINCPSAGVGNALPRPCTPARSRRRSHRRPGSHAGCRTRRNRNRMLGQLGLSQRGGRSGPDVEVHRVRGRGSARDFLATARTMSPGSNQSVAPDLLRRVDRAGENVLITWLFKALQQSVQSHDATVTISVRHCRNERRNRVYHLAPAPPFPPSRAARRSVWSLTRGTERTVCQARYCNPLLPEGIRAVSHSAVSTHRFWSHERRSELAGVTGRRGAIRSCRASLYSIRKLYMSRKPAISSL